MAQVVNRAKTDKNQTAIVKALEAAGCLVQSLAGVGVGCPDILVSSDGRWHVMEIKNGANPPSGRKLTDDEIKWHKKFNQYAPVWIVYDEIGALWVCGKTNEIPKIKPIRLVD